MRRLSSSFQKNPRKDSSFRVELPERSSTHLPQQKGPVSPQSNRVSSPGLESLRDFPEKKGENLPIYEPPEKEHFTPEHSAPITHEQPPQKRQRPRKLVFWLIALVTCIAVGLGVGLGVGLTRNKGSSGNDTQPSAGGPSQAGANTTIHNTLSRTGAFNGSGIALATQSFASGGYGSIVMYFQHHTGQIRSAQLDTNGNWKGGDETEIVAVDAKNATPIAAVAYARNNTAAWHIFYINVNNSITEVINSNTTNVWSPGPINDLHLQAMDDPNVGLQACWYGHSEDFYGHSPVPGQTKATGTGSDQTVGIHLWYAKNSTSFDAVGWTYGDTAWSEQQTFDGYNGHAGVGCYSWGPDSDTYVFFVNTDDEINILWKDLNTTLTGNTTHPVNEWTKSNVSIPVYQNSSVGFTNYLYVQNPDLSISGFNITWDAENTTSNVNQNFVINGERGIPGTHLSVTALPNTSGGTSLLTFYQTNGSDITEFVRDLDAGQWTSSSVPIPNS